MNEQRAGCGFWLVAGVLTWVLIATAAYVVSRLVGWL